MPGEAVPAVADLNVVALRVPETVYGHICWVGIRRRIRGRRQARQSSGRIGRIGCRRLHETSHQRANHHQTERRLEDTAPPYCRRQPGARSAINTDHRRSLERRR